MGCGSSSLNQVHDAKQEKRHKSDYNSNRPLLQNEKPIHQPIFYLFGQTQIERKIVSFHSEKLTFNTVTSRVRIPHGRVKLQPIQELYEQAQQVIIPNIFNEEPKPPFNCMLGLVISGDRIFLCGGTSYEEDYVSNESFLFNIPQESSVIANEIQSPQQMKNRVPKKKMNRFESLAKMNKHRYSHTGIFMKGVIFVFGGKNQKRQALTSCEKYRISEKKWEQIREMKTGRYEACSLEYMEKIYIFGGQSNHSKLIENIEVYDPFENEWKILQIKLHRGVRGGLIISPSANEILVFGGSTNQEVNPVIRVNLAEERYRWQTDLKKNKEFLKGCKVKNKILTFGKDNWVEEYDLMSKQWRKISVGFKSHIPIKDIYNFSFALPSLFVEYDPNKVKKEKVEENEKKGDEVYLFGNEKEPCILRVKNQQGGKKYRIEIDDVPMKLQLLSFMNCVKVEKGIFIGGGLDSINSKASKDVYLYNVDDKRVQTLAPMEESRYGFGIAYLHGYVYIFGGFTKSITRKVSIYDMLNNEWKEGDEITKGRSMMKTLVLGDDKILLFGGKEGNSRSGLVQIYDIVKNKVISMTEFKELEDQRIREIFAEIHNYEEHEEAQEINFESVRQEQEESQGQRLLVEKQCEQEEKEQEQQSEKEQKREEVGSEQRILSKQLIIQDIEDEDLQILIPNETVTKKNKHKQEYQEEKEQSVKEERRKGQDYYEIKLHLYKQMEQSEQSVSHYEQFVMVIEKERWRLKKKHNLIELRQLSKKVQYGISFSGWGKNMFLGKRISEVIPSNIQIETSELQTNKEYWKLNETSRYAYSKF